MYTKYENTHKKNFKRKDSKQAKVSLLIKDYFKDHKSITKDEFDNFLTFIELKTIWYTKEEQNILWNSILSYSINKKAIDYDATFKGIMDLFKEDEDEKKNKSNNNYKKEEINEIFDKYIKSLNGNIEYLYNIEFINFIFFENNNICLNNNNIDIIINDIKSKYKFLTINEKEIKNYFSCFNVNININKELINNINTLIENNLLDQLKNSNNCITYNDGSNNNSRSISFSTSANDTNSKNTNSFSSNNGELFDKLLVLDKIIFDCMDSLLYFYKNKNLINLIKKYIQNYLLMTKNNIYNNLKIIFENDNKAKRADSKISQIEENNININTNNINNNFVIETPKSKYLSKKELIYIKKPLESGKSYSNLLNLNKNKIIDTISQNIINNKNNNISDEEDINDNNINNIDNSEKNNEKLEKKIINRKIIHNRNKSDSNEKLISLHFNKKLQKNISYSNLSKLNQIKESAIFDNAYKTKVLSRNNNNFLPDKKGFQTQRNERNEESQFIETSIEDLNVFTFSDNLNDQYLMQTENIDDSENIIDKDEQKENKDTFLKEDLDYYKDFFNEKNEQNININKEKDNLLKNFNVNNFTFGKAENVDNEDINIKLSGDIDCNIPNYKKLSCDDKSIKIGYYDFKYLYKNNNIKKLFTLNKEKINPMKFFTDEIYIIPNNGLKKQKAIIVISGIYFYLLKSNTHMTCISKINNKSLNSISISSRNCNIILFSFENTPDILIETYRRIEILKYIKYILKDKKLKINISHNLAMNKKHGDNDSINKKKHKNFVCTPNFENAQKIGILLRLQENFFSSKFQERFVVLCNLGLMYFEENEKCPKVIIPIIGTTIKFLTAIGNEKLYCFKLKTINEECHIFGSKIKKEILDWIEEFSIIKKKYFLKLKEIEPNIIIHDKNKIHKQKQKK